MSKTSEVQVALQVQDEYAYSPRLEMAVEIVRLRDRLAAIERRVREIGGQFRRNAEAADNQGSPAVADHLRYAARTAEELVDAHDAGGEKE